MQDRLGPNRAGWGGIFQPLADGLKMFMKEEVIPVASNKFLFVLGPSLAMVAALMTSVVVPGGPDITIAGKTIHGKLWISTLACCTCSRWFYRFMEYDRGWQQQVLIHGCCSFFPGHRTN